MAKPKTVAEARYAPNQRPLRLHCGPIAVKKTTAKEAITTAMTAAAAAAVEEFRMSRVLEAVSVSRRVCGWAIKWWRASKAAKIGFLA